MHAIIHTWRYMPLLAWMWTRDGFAGLRMKLKVSQVAGLGAVASTLIPPPWTALTNRLLKTRNWYTPADTLHICSTSRSTPQVDWIRVEAQVYVPFFSPSPWLLSKNCNKNMFQNQHEHSLTTTIISSVVPYKPRTKQLNLYWNIQNYLSGGIPSISSQSVIANHWHVHFL